MRRSIKDGVCCRFGGNNDGKGEGNVVIFDVQHDPLHCHQFSVGVFGGQF